ncbi:50S ribosomal protein L19 [Patescibacteria group bacterium]|nr:50S ribosomal protein L19 [Patescibacteria group bacterium]MCG2694957.1 50S ribosomal protein L19 [Candidatus Parcubacteria bacterium]
MKTETNISPVNMEDRKKLGIRAGDTVCVWVKIQEKGKTRLQAFEGLVLATKHGAEAGATFTVRKVSNGVGIERIFPLYSPNVDKIEIVKRAKVRRAKLYHIRDKVAREIKRQMRKMKMVNISSLSGIGEEARIAKEEEITAKAKAEAEAEAQKKTDSEQPIVDSNEEEKKGE